MAAAGIATKYVTEVVAKVYDTGNNLGIWAPAWKDNCEFLEQDLKDTEGLDIKFPVDSANAEVLLVPPSADNFRQYEYDDRVRQNVSCRRHLLDHQHLLQRGRKLWHVFKLCQYEKGQQPYSGSRPPAQSQKSLLGRVRTRLEGRSGLHHDVERVHGFPGDSLPRAHLRPHLVFDPEGGLPHRQNRQRRLAGYVS